MVESVLIFIVALTVLLLAAKFFTNASEIIGHYFKLPQFVIGVFIVGIGTSLPELISGILAVAKNSSEILPGNIMGSNISNLLLVTGVAVVVNRKNIQLGSLYIYIDLHFLLASFFYFAIIAYDGQITFSESWIGLVIFSIYSVYLVRGGLKEMPNESEKEITHFPWKHLLILVVAGVGIFFGAEYTIHSLTNIATHLNVPKSIIALTLLSLGTTLPELVVNITAIKNGKAEMAIGNVLGSSVFNTLVIPSAASIIGVIQVPHELISFSLPVLIASGLFFYLITQDKKISFWEGMVLICLYVLFLVKIIEAN